MSVAPNPRYWTAEQVDYLRSHYSVDPAAAIAAALGKSYSSVLIRASRLGLVSAYRTPLQSVRADYFRALTRPIQAYILGWLAADGCVMDRGRVAIQLQDKDRAALELIRDELAPGKELTPQANRRVAGLVFQSPEMCRDLARYGIVPRKSLTLEWPANLSDALVAPFVLGYYDGDGSLTLVKGPTYRGWYPQIQIVGSAPFLLGLAAILRNTISIHIHGPKAQRTSRAFILYAYGSHVERLDAWMHDCGLGIGRKSLPRRLSGLVGGSS